MEISYKKVQEFMSPLPMTNISSWFVLLLVELGLVFFGWLVLGVCFLCGWGLVLYFHFVFLQ